MTPLGCRKIQPLLPAHPRLRQMRRLKIPAENSRHPAPDPVHQTHRRNHGPGSPREHGPLSFQHEPEFGRQQGIDGLHSQRIHSARRLPPQAARRDLRPEFLIRLHGRLLLSGGKGPHLAPLRRYLHGFHRSPYLG